MRFQHIVFNYCLYGENIIFAADMLVGCKVGNDMKEPMGFENLFKHGIAKVYGVGDKLFWNIVAALAPEVAHQFSQPVFVGVNHHQFGNFNFKMAFI